MRSAHLAEWLAAPALVRSRVLPPSAELGGREGPDLTRYLLVCAGLILLVGGLGWLVRRVLSRTLSARAGRRSLQVLDLLPLGGKQRVAVVRCYDRTFLLALGEKEIALLSELDAAIEPRRPVEPSLEERTFSDLVLRARPREPAGARAAAQVAERRGLDPGGILG
jgi:flagellar biosynthetic protein FliO